MGWAAGAGGGGGADGVGGVRGAAGVEGGGGAGGARGAEGVGDDHVLLSVCQPCWRCVLGVNASLVPICRQHKNRNGSS